MCTPPIQFKDVIHASSALLDLQVPAILTELGFDVVLDFAHCRFLSNTSRAIAIWRPKVKRKFDVVAKHAKGAWGMGFSSEVNPTGPKGKGRKWDGDDSTMHDAGWEPKATSGGPMCNRQ
jgi:hypothetical protein